jgi:hypothetical protein
MYYTLYDSRSHIREAQARSATLREFYKSARYLNHTWESGRMDR